MHWSDRHTDEPAVVLDAGGRDCGDGLLLDLRRQLDPLDRGQLLELVSTAASVEDDLPAWCKLTGHALVSAVRRGEQRSYLICKGALAHHDGVMTPPVHRPRGRPSDPGLGPGGELPLPADAPPVPPLAIMGIGSWPRPRWMLRAIYAHLEGRLADDDFDEAGDDAVRLAAAAQLRAGVDVVTDGEQRRDGYAGFVGGRLDRCQLVPVIDLLPYAADPVALEAELRALGVPLEEVRQPVVLGPLRRSRPLTGRELAFVRTLTELPAKVALPGPYLLTRLLSVECLTVKPYPTREGLAEDVVRILRDELFHLLAGGAALVQFDEPGLTDAAHGRPRPNPGVMTTALAVREDPTAEMAFAGSLLNRVVAGAPRERVALHVCRRTGEGYGPLLPLLRTLQVGAFFLELSAARPGEMAALRTLPESCRIGVGVVDPKGGEVASIGSVYARADEAAALFGPERVLLTPDCGFAPFAARPAAPAAVAEAKLAAVAQAARLLRKRYG
ncbi:MAG TPA: 5-methyltetrahydropteroyltriglutamate--homocysteine methyltransferase [Gemmataceae bacterium]|jgi:5-methyltetrahydropteroyltriglutamate--homocysteine methyltransferase